MAAVTIMDCRAAFISAGGAFVGCSELLDREPSIVLPGKNPAPTVRKIKERHVEHEHGIMESSTPGKTPAPRLLGVGFELFNFHF